MRLALKALKSPHFWRWPAFTPFGGRTIPSVFIVDQMLDCVAVGAKHLKVRDAVVCSVAVDVVYDQDVHPIIVSAPVAFLDQAAPFHPSPNGR
jgi:hypothetical protein